MTIELKLGDNLELLKKLEDNSIDSCVSDFPYNLSFMGKSWDTIPNYYQWCNDRAKELFRVLKPGAFCLIFSGTRTQHRMVCGFEDAGFEIKDQIMWVYSQGFPKSYNISKGFDKQDEIDLAKQWDGYGTALKPTHEPIMIAQKPIEKNYCYNVQKWGVGGFNIDGSRIELNGEIVPINKLEKWSGFGEEDKPDYEATQNTKGRYPANTIFDEEAGKELDEQSGILKSGSMKKEHNVGSAGKDGFMVNHGIYSKYKARPYPKETEGSIGGASRFYYCAKSSQKDRTENGQIENKHATVKPTTLMTHLIKLVTPPNGVNLDICEGSGTSAKACLWLEKDGYKVNHIGFENDEDSYNTALKRVELNKTQ